MKNSVGVIAPGLPAPHQLLAAAGEQRRERGVAARTVPVPLSDAPKWREKHRQTLENRQVGGPPAAVAAAESSASVRTIAWNSGGGFRMKSAGAFAMISFRLPIADGSCAGLEARPARLVISAGTALAAGDEPSAVLRVV